MRGVRTDSLAKLIRKAKQTKIGNNNEEGTTALRKHGLTRELVRKAVASVAAAKNPFTLWTMVEPLTQLNRQIIFAGDRMEAALNRQIIFAGDRMEAAQRVA